MKRLYIRRIVNIYVIHNAKKICEVIYHLLSPKYYFVYEKTARFPLFTWFIVPDERLEPYLTETINKLRIEGEKAGFEIDYP